MIQDEKPVGESLRELLNDLEVLEDRLNTIGRKSKTHWARAKGAMRQKTQFKQHEPNKSFSLLVYK